MNSSQGTGTFSHLGISIFLPSMHPIRNHSHMTSVSLDPLLPLSNVESLNLPSMDIKSGQPLIPPSCEMEAAKMEMTGERKMHSNFGNWIEGSKVGRAGDMFGN